MLPPALRSSPHLLATAALLGSTAMAAAAVCGTGSGEPVTIVAVAPDLELTTDDGRRMRLAGLERARSSSAEAGARLQTLIGGKPVVADVVGAQPDRWGRVTAVVSVDGTADLAALALRDGLGQYRPEPSAHACRADLLVAEEDARAARRGIWADPASGLLAIDDTAAFVARGATDVVAEGRLVGVQASPYRTKLRFVAAAQPAGTRYVRDSLAAVIAPRLLKLFRERNLDPDQLVGSVLRFRGLLDTRFGPQVELVGPDAIDVVAETTAKSAAGAAD